MKAEDDECDRRFASVEMSVMCVVVLREWHWQGGGRTTVACIRVGSVVCGDDGTLGSCVSEKTNNMHRWSQFGSIS